MGRIPLKRIRGGSPFRKIAMGSWRTAADPSVYGSISIDMTDAIKYMEEMEHTHQIRLSPAVLVGKATARVLKRRPEINSMIRFCHIYQRQSVDLFYQINVPGAKDAVREANLSGTVIRGAENMSAVGIARALIEQSQRVRRHEDPDMKMAMRTMALTPWFFIRWALNISSFLNYDLNLNLRWLGIPKDPFGSVMITNVGSLGIEEAWAPLVPYTRVPLLLTVGSIKDTPVVVNGKIEIRPIMKVGVTFDHRLIDGVHAADMGKEFVSCFADPWNYLS